MSSFTGFPPDALDFFEELEVHNERAWWQANRSRFEAAVRDPMRAMLDELEEHRGAFHVFRMNRDTRFSRDKSPYTLAHAAMAERKGGSTLYVHLSREGLFVGGGIYHPARDQLERFRAAVDDERRGAALEDAVAAVRACDVEVAGGEATLKVAPKGFPRDHPRIHLLRWKGCIASRDLGTPPWLHTARAAGEVDRVWQQAEPVLAWLGDHVGPAHDPPADRV